MLVAYPHANEELMHVRQERGLKQGICIFNAATQVEIEIVPQIRLICCEFEYVEGISLQIFIRIELVLQEHVPPPHIVSVCFPAVK
jgi:hypothetical protein